MTGLPGPPAAYLDHIWSNSGCRQPLLLPQLHSTNHSTGRLAFNAHSHASGVGT
jgi:hypothetical protein